MKSSLKIVQKYHPNVTSVVDAKDDIDIEILPRDLKNSKRKDPNSCALAKAICRSFDGAVVSIHVVYIVRGKTATRYIVPACVAHELVTFDRHSDFTPGEFYLRAPGKSQRMGANAARKQDPNRHKKTYGRHKHRMHYTSGIRTL